MILTNTAEHTIVDCPVESVAMHSVLSSTVLTVSGTLYVEKNRISRMHKINQYYYDACGISVASTIPF